MKLISLILRRAATHYLRSHNDSYLWTKATSDDHAVYLAAQDLAGGYATVGDPLFRQACKVLNALGRDQIGNYDQPTWDRLYGAQLMFLLFAAYMVEDLYGSPCED